MQDKQVIKGTLEHLSNMKDLEFQGYHKFRKDDGTEYGSFEVFYNEAHPKYAHDVLSENDGWFWWKCHEGCLPEDDPHGPFATAEGAYLDALEGPQTPEVLPEIEDPEGFEDELNDPEEFNVNTTLEEGTRYERAFGDGNELGG